MDEVNVAVIAPILGRDLSFVSDVDPRVRVFDANFAAPGRRAGPGGPEAHDPRLLAEILAQAEVLLVGYPVPGGLAARCPRLAWAHHTQAGVEPGRDRPVGLAGHLDKQPRRDGGHGDRRVRPRRGGALRPGPARGRPPEGRGQFTRAGYEMLTLRGATMGSSAWAASARRWPAVARGRHAGDRHPPLGHRPAARCRRGGPGTAGRRILQVAAESDFLVVCSQLTAETRGFINAQVFAAMKPDAVLINVARGEEVDEDALVTRSPPGRIRGAVLDVYDGELAGRPPRPELTALPQILLTPHISGSGDTNVAEPLRKLFTDNLRRYLDGQPLRNVVDRARGY